MTTPKQIPRIAALLVMLIMLPCSGCLRTAGVSLPPPAIFPSDTPPAAVFSAPDPAGAYPSKPSAHIPLRLSLDEAILLSLENNRSLQVQRFDPLIRQTDEEIQASVFDTQIEAEVSGSRQELPSPADPSQNRSVDDIYMDVQLRREFSTGTRLSLGVSESYGKTSQTSRQHQIRTGMSLSQRLLAGAGAEVVLASLNQARLTTQASRYEFAAYAETMVATVIEAYWDYYLARQNTLIYIESLGLANRQVSETQDMIKVGRLAQAEMAAAEAEAALRRQDLIDARSTEIKQRLRLLRLLSSGAAIFDNSSLELLEYPVIPEEGVDVLENHVDLAQIKRPEIHQARLGMMRQDLEVVKTRNGLLPRLDFFVGLGKSGYAASFDRAVSDWPEDRYDLQAGLLMAYAPGNRRASAQHQQAELVQAQLAVALENLQQLVELDVRLAYTEALRAREQIAASASLVSLQEEKLRTITEKYRVGRSISFIVAQAQRDLTSARLSAVAARIGYLKALARLYETEGTLLERRGLLLPY